MKKFVIIVVAMLMMLFGVKAFLSQCDNTTTITTLATDGHFVGNEGTITYYEIGR